jgi:hypothetical protein
MVNDIVNPSVQLCPFGHLVTLFEDIISINDADYEFSMHDYIKNIIVSSYPNALHVVHLNSEDLVYHFDDVYNLFYMSIMHVLMISESW